MTQPLTPALLRLVERVRTTDVDAQYAILDNDPTRYAEARNAHEAARADLIAALDPYPRPCVLEGWLSDGKAVSVRYYRDPVAERRTVRITTN